MFSSLDPYTLFEHPNALPMSQFLSAWTNVLIALPSFLAFMKWYKKWTGFMILVALGVFAWLFEAQSIITGWPYSGFSYGDIITGKIAGLVPWTVPFAWTPLLLGCYWMVLKIKWIPWHPVFQIGTTAALLVITDLVLDPVATRLGFWHWQQGGWFYGVPVQNFLGWFVSGSIGATILHVLLEKKTFQLSSRWVASSWRIHLISWTLLAWILGLWIPAAIGTAFWISTRSLVRSGNNF